ncbi:MAG TPA: glycosyltransferase family A protein [Candidatus Paceibacterota bacterium]|nr:glycosyltransferase family A protein [Candidatus Paceibacterota bacterium]
MKLSFSIPAHNEEKRIGQCLESVQKEIARAKMESDTEIVVVNNASNDRTKEIALSYPGVRVVDEMQKGLTHARQAGFVASTGALIANVDADTMVPPGWLDTVMRAFEKDPQLVALSGPYIYFDLSPAARFFVKVFYAVGYVTYLFNKHVLHAGAMLQGGNFVVRRDAMEKIGGFDTSIKFYGEDTDVARRISKVGKVVWTFRLPMYTSGRRLAKEGIVKIGMRYALNYLWTTFTGKPWSETYIDIRTDWRH